MTRIVLDVPGEVWWKLAGVAERSGVGKVDRFLVDLIKGITSPDPVLTFHAQGLTNKQIADRTGILVATVATRVRRAGLKPNKQTAPAAHNPKENHHS